VPKVIETAVDDYLSGHGEQHGGPLDHLDKPEGDRNDVERQAVCGRQPLAERVDGTGGGGQTA